MRGRNVIALGVSALLHLSVPTWLFLSGSKVVPAPAAKPVPLTLNMFKPAPPPKVVEQVVEPVVIAKVEPTPKPKPKVKPKPKPKPKFTQKPKPKPIPEPEPVIEPMIEPIADEVIEVEIMEPQIVRQQPEFVPPQTTQLAPAQQQPPQPAIDPNKLALIESSYQSRLRDLIEAKKTYPRRAKRLGREGMATVTFVVLPDGTIEEVQLKQGSGTKVLDQAAMKTILSLSGAIPFPNEIKRSRWVFTIPIAYDLI